MTKDPREFPLKPVEDWIIIEKIPIKSNEELMAGRSNIELIGGVAPKNIMDIEKNKARDLVAYEDAEGELLKKWNDHPFQGTVKAVGPGRPLEEEVIIPMPVKVGDHVYFRNRTGEPIIVDGKLYWMLKSHEIFAVKKRI